MTEKIMAFYDNWQGKEGSPVFVGVMFGAMFIYPMLLQRFPAGHSPIVGTIRAKSYKKNGKRSTVEISHPCFDTDIRDRNIVIVDDIVESGYTLLMLKEWFEKHGAADVRTFALLDKPSKRQCDIEVDWVGFQLAPNQWVVGMGLDDNNHYRHFNNIVVVNEVKSKPKPK